MGILTVVEILSTFGQYLGIIGSVNISWPAGLQFFNSLRYLRLDLSIKLPNVSVPTLDVRSQHLLLTNVVPIVASIILLIFFKPLAVVIFSVLIIAGLGSFFVGVCLLILPQSQLVGQSYIPIVLVAGGITLEVILAIVYFCKSYNKKRALQRISPQEVESPLLKDEEGALDLEAILRNRQGKRRPFLFKLLYFVLFIIFIGAGVLIIGLPVPIPDSQLTILISINTWLQSLGEIIGWISISIGIIAGYMWLSSLSQKLQQFNDRVKYLASKNCIKLVLVILGILYIPMCSSIFNMFMCSWVTVPQGSQFTDKQTTLSVSSLISSFLDSDSQSSISKCSFLEDKCPSTLAQKLCPETKDLRLNSDSTLSCLTEIYPFYLPGAAISIFTIIIGIPFLYYRLIWLSHKFISFLPVQSDTTAEEQWKDQCHQSKSSCKSLFSMFEMKWRYYKLVALLHKLIIVAILIVGNSSSFPVLCALTATHCAFAVTSIISRPYLRTSEDLLATMCLIVNIGNAALAVLVTLSVPIPTFVGPLTAALNIALPVCALLIGIRSDKLRSKLRDSKDINIEKKDNSQIINTLDQELDARLRKTLVNSFLILGLGSFLGFIIAMVGYFYLSTTSIVVGPVSSNVQMSNQLAAAAQFGEYKTWEEFTTNCCCQANTNSTNSSIVSINATTTLVEAWKCLSNSKKPYFYKFRTRISQGQSGLYIRPYCSPDFNTTTVLGSAQYVSASGNFQVQPNGGIVLTTYQSVNLW